ncbi:MAG: hypothetical protein ACUVV4_07245 [Candidatus Bathyarchaeia archaeon]
MSEKVCCICGRKLNDSEIKINEISKRGPLKRGKYICSKCRKIEYEQYVKAVKELIEKE